MAAGSASHLARSVAVTVAESTPVIVLREQLPAACAERRESPKFVLTLRSLRHGQALGVSCTSLCACARSPPRLRFWGRRRQRQLWPLALLRERRLRRPSVALRHRPLIPASTQGQLGAVALGAAMALRSMREVCPPPLSSSPSDEPRTLRSGA